MLKVWLIAHTPTPEKIVAAAAKQCYSNSTSEKLLSGMTEEAARDFVHMLSEIGHESPIEHASFTFAIEGVSRSLLAQITRHRIASFSVQSQRYVKIDNFEYVTPPEIADDEKALRKYESIMKTLSESYSELSDLLYDKHIKALCGDGEPTKEQKKKAQKQAIEDARYVLPNACETKMVMTMNARSLQNFFRIRCCGRAQWEIRELAWQMLALCREAAPSLFARSGPSCLHGPCSEGKMSCGEAAKMRERSEKIG
ncbi:MAG: FAD-dependent thymidylate synthase [Clostridia bacterium]|nr:FAD-dependent thymidylate synthase [Clostridia bacterium]